MKREHVVAALLLLGLVAASLFTQRGETPTVATRASGDYGFGGYRAFYELLEREGVHVTRFRNHHDALSGARIDTLVVAFPEDGVESVWDRGERDALRAWVRRGGRLVDIGLTPRTGNDDAKGEQVVLDNDEGHLGRGPLTGTWAALVADVPKRGVERLTPVARAHVERLLADHDGALVVRYAYGRGSVVGVANAALFENRSIGLGDDARLAVLAAQPGRPGGIVAFDESVRGDIAERPWYTALNAAELVALGLAALAGLLWLLYGIVPLGPAVRLRAPREPTSHEFVDAVAALYGRARARDHARDALLRDARRSLEKAPRTAANAALERRVSAARDEPVATDAELVAVAALARTARENVRTMTTDRPARPSVARRPPPRGRSGGAR